MRAHLWPSTLQCRQCSSVLLPLKPPERFFLPLRASAFGGRPFTLAALRPAPCPSSSDAQASSLAAAPLPLLRATLLGLTTSTTRRSLSTPLLLPESGLPRERPAQAADSVFQLLSFFLLGWCTVTSQVAAEPTCMQAYVTSTFDPESCCGFTEP